MSILDRLFPILWLLAFLSPIVAIVFAALFYARHRKGRPAPERRIPAVAYALVLLVCAIGSYLLGLGWGIATACSSPKSPNLCGLWGVFVTGPFAAALAIFLVGSLITLLPPDQTS